MDHRLLPIPQPFVTFGLLALTAFFVVRGLVPALSGITTDFPNYYTSARLVTEGRDITHIYHDDWFQDRIREYGMDQDGKFSPFPPPTALLLVPLAALPPSEALRVFTLLNCALLFVGVHLVRTIVGVSPGGATKTRSTDDMASSPRPDAGEEHGSLPVRPFDFPPAMSDSPGRAGTQGRTPRQDDDNRRIGEAFNESMIRSIVGRPSGWRRKSDDPFSVEALKESALIILLSGLGLANCFRFGQWYVVMSVALLAAYRFFRIGRPYISGMLLGFFLPIKYFPLFPLLAFLLVREWKVVASALVTAALVVVVSVCVLGWPVHEEFLGRVLFPHLGGHFGNQGSFTSAFQSWDALFRQLFVHDSNENPTPMIDAPALFWIMKLLVSAMILSGVALTLRRVWSIGPGGRLDAAIVLFSIAGLLLAPGTATYHFVLLWLPVALLLSLFARHGQVLWERPALALYGLIGFIYYTFFQQFDRTGPGSILSFPRLALLAGLFCVTLAGISRISGPARQEQETEKV